MVRDPRVFLAEVDFEASEIIRATREMDYEAFAGNGDMQYTIRLRFQVIGEALNSLHRTDPAIADRIDSLRKIVDFRNVLVHRYWIVEPELIWHYAEEDLPKLHEAVQALLAEVDSAERMTPAGR